MQETIFTSKYFNDRIHVFDIDSIKDLANKKQLINRWITAFESGNLSFSKETQIDLTFLNDIFGEVLDYAYEIDKEKINLIPKSSIDSKEPDAILGFFTQQDRTDIRVVVELKDSKTDLDRVQNRLKKISPVTQAYEYARKAGETCKWIIVSNIQTIRLYNKESDRYEVFNLTDLKDDFHLKRFFFLLHKDRLFFQTGESYVDILYRERLEKEKKIEKEFYTNYHSIRTKLVEHLIAYNKEIEPTVLLEKTQKILDRIIFICFCADLDIIPKSILQEVIKTANPSFRFRKDLLWTTLQELFYTLDLGNNIITKLNGGLFEEDEILNNLKITDTILLEVLKLSEYDYRSDLNVNILGHIFEQSISDLEKMKQNLLGFGNHADLRSEQNGKRKAFGIFYTPEHITKYIVKEAIESWLDEQKQELGEKELPILTDKDYELIKITKQGKLRTNEKIEKNKQFWENYLDRLLSIKILDPACGSGAFLVECLNFLITEYRNVQKELRLLSPPVPPDEYKSKLKQELTINLKETEFDIEEHILRHNLYGVDINFESVEITRLSLWLKTVKRGKVLTDIDFNIQQGNSLISDSTILGDLAFDWNIRFKDILSSGDFDVIVGNPPWGAALSTKEKEFLKITYENIDSSTPNTFSYFLGLFLKLGKKIGVIIPDSFLIKDFEKTRLLYKDGIKKLSWYQNSSMPENERPFPLVDHDVVAIIYDAKNSLNQIEYSLREYKNAKIVETNFIREKNNICDSQYFSTFNLLIDDISINLKNRFKNYSTVETITQIHEGIHSGNCRELLFKNKKTRGDEKPLFIGGKNGDIIENYYSQMSGWFVDYRKELIDKDKGYYASLRNSTIFTKPKVYITRTGNPFKSFIDTDNYASNNFFSLQLKDYKLNTLENLSFFVCLFNSKFAQYYVRKIIAPRIGSSFVETKIIHLLKIPIPTNFWEYTSIFKNYVDKIVSQKKELQKEKDIFFKTLHEDKRIEKISLKIENLQQINYEEFKTELAKQKIKFTLGDENNQWREYFNTTKEKFINLQNQIDSTDKEINRMIYKLYLINVDEIQLIENQ